MPLPRHEPRPPRGARGGLPALVAVLLGVLLAAAATAEAKGTKTPETKFGIFEAGWKARSADKVTACMEPKGTVTFRLLAYPLSGKARSMKPEQAKATLKAYFKKVSSVALKNVSPKKSPKNIRLYEYTYKPAGENARTTHLRVQLKQDKNRLWVLASVTESAKPRS
ncbi:MAG: hypothetical protein QNJ90_12870 [Planctomycetota bacterium]|nr:hypothetical protein [Planctomycetota bacterium]